MNMKKGIFIVWLLWVNLCTLSAQTENPVGKFSVIPRVGVTIANLTHNSLTTFREGDHSNILNLNSKAKAGFMGGLDVEYRISQPLAWGIGAYYAQQGYRYPDYAQGDPSKAVGNSSSYVGIHDHHANLHYLNVPLYVKGYLVEGLAVMVGVQMGNYISGKEKYEETQVQKNKDGSMTYGKTSPKEDDIHAKTTEWSIPIGLSYEYEHVILDARYHIGLSRVIDGSESMKNKTITVSVGYRFML